MAGRFYYRKRAQRQQLRMPRFDYASPGAYFVTICTHRKSCLFGEIINDRMVLNVAGRCAHACWLAIPEHFPNALLEEFVIMPNHVHGIIRLKQLYILSHVAGNTDLLPAPYRQNRFQHMIPGSVSAIVKGFKIGVTKWFRYGLGALTRDHAGAEYFQPLHDHDRMEKIWQRSFHDHIIRNEEEYNRIKYYIINNPKNWHKDKFHRP